MTVGKEGATAMCMRIGAWNLSTAIRAMPPPIPNSPADAPSGREHGDSENPDIGHRV